MNNDQQSQIDQQIQQLQKSQKTQKIIAIIVFALLIIGIIILSYFLYDNIMKKNSLTKDIEKLQKDKNFLKLKLIDIIEKIIKIDNLEINKYKKDNLDFDYNVNYLTENVNILIEQYKELKGVIETKEKALTNSKTEYTTLKSELTDLNNALDYLDTGLNTGLNTLSNTLNYSNLSNLSNNILLINNSKVNNIIQKINDIKNKLILRINQTTPPTQPPIQPPVQTNILTQEQINNIKTMLNTLISKYSLIAIKTSYANDNEMINDKLNQVTKLFNTIDTILSDFKNTNNNKNIIDLSRLILTSYANNKISDNLNLILNQQKEKINNLISENNSLKESLNNMFVGFNNEDTLQPNDNLLNYNFEIKNNELKQGFDNPPSETDIKYLKNYIKVSKYTLDNLHRKINNLGSSTVDASSKFSSANEILNAIDQKILLYNTFNNNITTLSNNNTSVITLNTQTNNSRIPLNKLHGFIFLNRTIAGNDTISVSGGNRLFSIGDCLNNTPSCYAYTNTESGNWLKRNLNNTNSPFMELNNNTDDTKIHNTFINSGDVISNIKLVDSNSTEMKSITDAKIFDNYNVLQHVIITNAEIVDEGNILRNIDPDKNNAYFNTLINNRNKNNCIANVTNGKIDRSYNADGARIGQYNGLTDYTTKYDTNNNNISDPWCEKFKLKQDTSKLIKLKRSPDTAVYIYNPLAFDFSAL